MTLTELLATLVKQGCWPSVLYRGNGIWRAYVNGAGNFSADSSTPQQAMNKALMKWEKAGKPMDGYAATEKAR